MNAASAEVARDLQSLPDLMRLVDDFFATTSANPEVRMPVELAIEEIFTNMVRHNASGSGPIRLDLRIGGDDLVIRITDFDAPRFDPVVDAPPPDVDSPLERRRIGGLGIHLVKKMMDGIEYSHRNRTGTVTLHKRMN